MHPAIVGLIAMLVALAIFSVVLFHRKAQSVLAGHEALAADSDAMLIDLMGGTAR